MSGFQSVYAGLPMNYINNPMYMFYMQQLAQSAQQSQLFAQQQAQQRAELEAQQRAQAETQMNAQYAPVDTLQQTQASQAVQTQQEVQVPSVAQDGQDDGKISWKSKLKNFGKGIGNFFKGMVCDENGKFSLKRTATTLAVGAAAVGLTVATGGAAAPYLVGAGIAMGVFETGKGAYKAYTATTDAEAEQAWQSIGSGVTGIGLSVAGAKGAMKASGADMAKYAGIKGYFAATKDCLSISAKGVLNGSKFAFTHSPVTTYKTISSYYKNTMKPNLQQAFSYKNGHKNYTDAQEAKLNKDIAKVDEKIAKLNAEKAQSGIKPERITEIDAEIAKLNNNKVELQFQKSDNTVAGNVHDLKQQAINEIDTKLKDPNLSAAERTQLQQDRLNLYKGLKDYEKTVADVLKLMEEQINAQKDIVKANPTDDAALQTLKSLESNYKYAQQRAKIELAQNNINKTELHIDKLKQELKKPVINKAQADKINAKIAGLEKSVAGDKQILRNSNMLIAAKQQLPNIGTATASSYLSFQNAGDSVVREQQAIAEQQYYTQMAQEQAALQAQQQAYEQAMQQAEQAQQAQQTQQMQNPYMSNPYGQYTMSMPQGSGFDFNSLYVSPYPEYI